MCRVYHRGWVGWANTAEKRPSFRFRLENNNGWTSESNLIEYNFIHIRIYLSRAFFSILFLDLDCRFLGRTPRV